MAAGLQLCSRPEAAHCSLPWLQHPTLPRQVCSLLPATNDSSQHNTLNSHSLTLHSKISSTMAITMKADSCHTSWSF